MNEPEQVMVPAFLYRWLREKTNLSDVTRKNYAKEIRNRLVPSWIEMPVSALQVHDVEALRLRLVAQGFAPITITCAFRVLSQALASAVESGMLETNPCLGL